LLTAWRRARISIRNARHVSGVLPAFVDYIRAGRGIAASSLTCPPTGNSLPKYSVLAYIPVLMLQPAANKVACGPRRKAQ
jgi:hypothetical protein